MISPAMLGTADDGKRLVLYPLELTLRDLFAMAVMQGCFAADRPKHQCPSTNFPIRATYCYAMADAMLAERAK